MSISTISYWIYDAINSMKKNKKNVIISIGTMVTTMVIIAITFAVIKNASYVIEQRRNMESRILACAVEGATEEQIANIKRQLDSMPEVTGYDFQSSEDGLKYAIAEDPILVEGFSDEMLATLFPARFSISFSEVEHEDIIIEKLKNIDGIGKESSDVQPAATAKEAIRKAKIYQILCTVLLAYIVILSIFLIVNSTKLMLYAKRKEISIMKYVGATDGFVKIPFIIESVMVAMLAVLVTVLVFNILYTPIISAVTSDLKFLQSREILPSLTGMLMLIGIAVGVVGSSISMNKYLDV